MSSETNSDEFSTNVVTTAGPVSQQVDFSITPVQQLLASGTGALITSFLVTPLDVVKIRLQSQIRPITRGQCFLYCNGLMDHLCTCINGNGVPMKQWYNTPGHFNGAVDAFVQIAKKEGIPKLWSGLSPTLVMAVPATVLYYTTYDWLKLKMGYNYETSSMGVPVLAGGLARLFAVTVISPLELVRTKMQSRPLTYKEILGCVRTAVQDGGLKSLWRGWGPTILRDVPFSAVLWFNYEMFKAKLMKFYNLSEPTFPVSFMSGAMGGGIAAYLTTPFDVVKTHRQIELGEINIGKKMKQPTSTWGIMRRINQGSGTRGLFAGLGPRLAKVAPACAIMIGTYEYGKKFFHHYNEIHRGSQ